MNLLDNLNDKQKEAVLHTEGPLLVLAGAGSGKTKVLTTRIAHILNEGLCNKYEILAITFTNKAASEMKVRVEKILGYDVSDMWIGTFHSICTRILRREITHIGYTSNFTIYDRADQISLVKEILREKGMDVKEFQTNAFLSIVSNTKNIGEGKEYLDSVYKDNPTFKRYGELFEEYVKKTKMYNSLDFDDLILKTLELFKTCPDIAERYSGRFKYVFVDEYQDTNKSQYDLIRYLTEKNNNICVVGDGDQSIYGWRGADISNILNFEKDFKNAKVILLEQNYRSSKKILKVANSIIKNNEERKDKSLWTENDHGDDIIYKKVGSDLEESITVTNWIEHMKYNGYSFEDMAILYRTNSQSRIFEETLMREGINYHVVGGLKFYDRKEIKDIVAYLKIIVNSDDNISLKRIINSPKRGIGDTTLAKLEVEANIKGMSIYKLIEKDLLYMVSPATAAKLREFLFMMNNLKNSLDSFSVSGFVEFLLDKTGYLKALKDSKLREDKTRLENIGAFLTAIIDYEKSAEEPSLEDYLASVSLLSDVDKTEEGGKGVSLMTIHAAKGLEYKVVFLTGMEEGLFPSERSIYERDGLEEERRLCYVAVTRAEERLYITSSMTRRVFGKTMSKEESRFIEEMKENIVEDKPKEIINTNFRESYSTSVDNMANDLRDPFAKKPKQTKKTLEGIEIKPGDKVKHKAFGEGTVVSVAEKADGDELVIAFDKKGIKKLNKNLAPLEIV
ncbi:ATP-dependent helicase [Miniphocaeibacter massiliensis]|uniref:ATP-dependent helicase n=1 Tax=Miniphocaeibacter massiliensis TaxID=2041841 RepID=UPI000C0897E9|nr:UvrD-helicase domain-containing protein [Miniphocaeibacter massiliensis]